MNDHSTSKARYNRTVFIIQAAVEYLISITVTGSFFAKLTKELGISDSLTGILSAIVSLGCLFQLLSISVRRTRVKKLVITFSIINQILFMLLYVVPLTNFEKQTKICLFAILIVTAYLFYNFVHPEKMNWLVSTVNDGYLGSFTASKEIVSLISGMVFSFLMGSVVDHFSQRRWTGIVLILSALVIFVLMILNTLALTSAIEDETETQSSRTDLKQTVRELLTNKRVLYITVIYLLYNVSRYSSIPFYATYQVSELDMSLATVSIITICGSISRISVSMFWGRYADKVGFALMLEKCFCFFGISQIFIVFALPSNALTMFILYSITQGIAMGGINSGLENLIFEYIAPESRADALAVTQALAGAAGFLATLSISPLVSYIQRNGNSLFGISMYAQQFITAISLLFTVIAVLYTRFILVRSK